MLVKFKVGDCNILICMDVVSWGFDILLVNLVINYDILINFKDYIYRVGRIVRVGRLGWVILMVC